MTLTEIKDYCLSKKGATADFPFDEATLVFRVGDKMFGLTNIKDEKEDISINLKCNPDLAIEYRSMYDAVIPGYHMNKKHWNTVSVNTGLAKEILLEMIDHSYNLVYGKLPKKLKLKIEEE